MQGVIQLGHGVLQDALGLGGGGPEHRKLFIHEPLLQLLLLRLLEGTERRRGHPAERHRCGGQAGGQLGASLGREV